MRTRRCETLGLFGVAVSIAAVAWLKSSGMVVKLVEEGEGDGGGGEEGLWGMVGLGSGGAAPELDQRYVHFFSSV